MQLVIDENSWVVDIDDPNSYIAFIEEILDTIESASNDGHECLYSEDLFNFEVIAGWTFYDLYGAGSPIPIPKELRDRLAAVFNYMLRWTDLPAEAITFDTASIEHQAEAKAASVCWALRRTCEHPSHPVAVVCHERWRKGGCLDVHSNGYSSPIWFVTNPDHLELVFRWIIEKHSTNMHELTGYAAYAFKQLIFVPGCFEGIRTMEGKYRDLKKDIVKHLAALSDEGSRIFSGPWQAAEAEFNSIGVSLSDENGKTKSNNRARRQREIEWNGKTYFAWWHTKLEPHRNRIHFCPDLANHGGKLMVGIFCKHLS